SVDQTACIVLPAASQEQRLLYTATHGFLKMDITSRGHIGAHANHIPEYRINATNQMPITHLTAFNAHIARDLTMRTLIMCQRCERSTKAHYQVWLATGQGGKSGDDPITRPDTGIIVNIARRSKKTCRRTTSPQQVESTGIGLTNFIRHLLNGHHNPS